MMLTGFNPFRPFVLRLPMIAMRWLGSATLLRTPFLRVDVCWNLLSVNIRSIYLLADTCWR
jgi:hypothetical protein